jgi:hypothetical protein
MSALPRGLRGVCHGSVSRDAPRAGSARDCLPMCLVSSTVRAVHGRPAPRATLSVTLDPGIENAHAGSNHSTVCRGSVSWKPRPYVFGNLFVVHRILADDGMTKWLLGLLLSISGAFDPPRPPPEVCAARPAVRHAYKGG